MTSITSRRSASERILAPAIIIVVIGFTLTPFVSMLLTALQPRDTIPTGLSWPTDPQWHNFVDAWTAANMTALLQSSAIIVLGVVPASLVCATMAGYALGQLRIPAARPLFLLFVAGLTIPFEALVVPLYYEMRDLGLLNTRAAVILALIGLFQPFGVFWMRAHFVTFPPHLAEAARVDGAGPWASFRRIHLPLAMPAIAALGLLQFLTTWNQFILAIILIDDPAKRTMAGALGAFVGEHSTDIVLICAGALLIMLPGTIVFIILQRQFVRALLQGAVKG